MKYKTIFFDLDHTLWDFEENSKKCLAIIYEEMDLDKFLEIPFESFHPVYEEINKKYWARYRNGFITRKDLRWKRMQAVFLHFKKYDKELAHRMGERYLELLPEQDALFPFAKEVLDHCVQKGLQLEMITNGFEETQRLKMNRSNIGSYFDTIVTSENAMCLKPDPEIYHYAMRNAGAELSSSIMIGDNLDVDILGAQRVEMDQVYFNPRQISHEGNPTFEIHCLSELLEIL